MSSALGTKLNQPLGAALAYLQAGLRLLQAEPSAPGAKPLDALRKAAEQVQRASDILRRLRDFARKGEAVCRVEDLAKVIEEANALAMVGTRSLGVSLHLELYLARRRLHRPGADPAGGGQSRAQRHRGDGRYSPARAPRLDRFARRRCPRGADRR